jgi:hypothetical protein
VRKNKREESSFKAEHRFKKRRKKRIIAGPHQTKGIFNRTILENRTETWNEKNMLREREEKTEVGGLYLKSDLEKATNPHYCTANSMRHEQSSPPVQCSLQFQFEFLLLSESEWTQ